MDLRKLEDKEIILLAKENKITVADFVDSSICPTCFDNAHDFVLYGNKNSKMIYEDDNFECFLVGNPRAAGHTAISVKKHYKDMLEIDDELCRKIFVLAKKTMKSIKDVYGCESVYLCTMCDGPMNHFHVQLIPRYSYEKRGSNNFVKPRLDYKEDRVKIDLMKMKLK